MSVTAKNEPKPLSHNLLGQRLGRKGRDTRERILAATARLLAAPSDAPISLSAVAREASLGMTSLYLYFGDLTVLLLAALEPIMASAEETYIAQVRTRWPDSDLASHCVAFVRAYHEFWQRHTRILHLRNSLADANDSRMREHRIKVAQPLIGLLVGQMGDADAAYDSPSANVATVLITGIERLVTVTTDAAFMQHRVEQTDAHVENLLRAQARILELAVRDCRAAMQ